MVLNCRRISHRTHHQNHGHVENDESWHPVSDIICLWNLCYFVGLHYSIFAFAFLRFLNLFFLLFLMQLPEKIYKSLDGITKMLRFTVPFPMLAYPIYLVSICSFFEQFYSELKKYIAEYPIQFSGAEVLENLVHTLTQTVICSSQVREKM